MAGYDENDPSTWYNDVPVNDPVAAPPPEAAAEPGYWTKFAQRLNPANNLRETLSSLDTPTGSKFVQGAAQGAMPGGGLKAATQIDARNGLPAPGTQGPKDDTPQGPANLVGRQDPAPPVVMLPPGAVGARRAIPAHWQPGTHAVSMQHGMAPGELEPGQYNRDVAAGQGLLAGDARLEAAQRTAQADALYAVAHTQASQVANAKLEGLRVQRERYVADERAKLEKLAGEIQNTKVDPDQIWKDKGGFAKVMSAIAIGLGQFGASMRGGPNTAFQIVQGQIDASIDAQKQAIASKRLAFDTRSNLYAKNLEAFGDRERAVLATKINYLDQVAGMVEAQKAVAKSKNAEAAAFDLNKRIYDERAQYADQFAKLTHTQVAEQQNERFVPAQVIGGAAGIGTKGKEELFVPSLGVYARTPEEAKKMREHGFRTTVIVNALSEAKGILDEAKKTSNPIELAKLQDRLNAIKSRSAVVQTVKQGQGAMSEGDKVVSEASLGLFDATVWRPNMMIENQSKILDDAISAAQKEHGRYGQGQLKGVEAQVQKPDGTFEPRQILTGDTAPYRNATDNVDDLVSKPKGVAQPR